MYYQIEIYRPFYRKDCSWLICAVKIENCIKSIVYRIYKKVEKHWADRYSSIFKFVLKLFLYGVLIKNLIH